ncbi:MFS transporter [Streptomyces sp. NPDC020379]|uniref:MFS transporter n=1 Tax=Streptomyces sp. NPDC020379 TaxID=3365071 RepID=UPI0037B9E27B
MDVPLAPISVARVRRPAAVGTICLGLYLLGMDLTVLNVALPDIQKELHPSTAQAQWIVDGYALVLGGLVLSTGAVTDRIGRRLAFTSGLILCAAVSVIGALATSPGVVVIARGGMGAGAALFMPATLSIIRNLFPEPALRRRAIAAWSAVAGLGTLTGPVIGGVLVERFSWRAGFWINVPLALTAVLLALVLVPETRAGRAERPDIVGTVLSAAGLTILVWAVIEAPTKGWTSQPVLIAFVAAGVLLGALAIWQSRARAPMLPPFLLRDRRIVGGTVALAMMSFAVLGALFVLTLYLQNILGYTPLEAGLRTLPQSAAMAAGAVAALPLLNRCRAAMPIILGLLLASAAFSFWALTTPGSGYGRLLAVELVAGLGVGLVSAAGTEAVIGAIPPDRAALGSALNDATRQVGASLGVAVQGSVLATVYTNQLTRRLTDLHLTSPSASRPTGRGLPGSMTTDQLSPEIGRAVTAAIRSAFVDALDVTAAVAAAVTLVTAVAAAYWLRHR